MCRKSLGADFVAVTELPVNDISPEHMKQLYAVSKAKRKVWKEMPNGTHNETVTEPYFFNHVFDFISEELMA